MGLGDTEIRKWLVGPWVDNHGCGGLVPDNERKYWVSWHNMHSIQTSCLYPK